jgi:hypothetical protein
MRVRGRRQSLVTAQGDLHRGPWLAQAAAQCVASAVVRKLEVLVAVPGPHPPAISAAIRTSRHV